MLPVLGINILFDQVDSLVSDTYVTVCTDSIFSLIKWILFIPSFMVAIKRSHDRNRSGWFLLFLFIPIAITLVLSGIWLNLESNGSAAVEDWYWVIGCGMWIILIPAVWVLIELGFIKGTKGSNKYGPNPLKRP